MRKPQDWGQPCPNPDCSHYRLITRGNMSAIATSLTQSGKRRIFRCGACEKPFSERGLLGIRVISGHSDACPERQTFSASILARCSACKINGFCVRLGRTLFGHLIG